MNINKPTTPPVILTVSALNQTAGRLLEQGFGLTWIAGEISNLTRAASGHYYFTLKDDAAQVRAVMFRGRAQYADFSPRDGDKVEVRAMVTLYAPRGDYQLNVESIRRAGVGNLYEAFLQLKNKLNAEGLFDASRKRTLPIFPRTLGIVTSPQAAALRDVLTTLKRRAPHIQLILYPTPVQGHGAAEKIAHAIQTASARAECQVLLVCRGGGSIEDLWAFNEEIVARAITTCRIPVISGVGHETDITIADFSADVRAPTPTAAAEMAATTRADWLAMLATHADDLTRAMHKQCTNAAQRLDWLSAKLISPSAYIHRERMKLHALFTNMTHAIRLPLIKKRFALTHLGNRLTSPSLNTKQQRNHLTENKRRIATCMNNQLAQHRLTLSALNAQLELLNPQRTLERGYSIVTDTKGKLVRSPQQIHPRTTIIMRSAEGTAELHIAQVQAMLE